MCRGAPNKKREDIKTNNLQGSERTNVTQAHQREKYAARVQIRKQVRENTAILSFAAERFRATVASRFYEDVAVPTTPDANDAVVEAEASPSESVRAYF